ncbi:MAG: imidazole glycerol phosphate synthase subunit HisH [Candidatus Omnitrophica bacterium]|nr:imidazole glycerol phosphate synthase subunit HisH [Candidatus Omnitrophota bacterium]MCG2705051.1 imidazole glycerol phosphate synthase subunit HisH [Candidatus Omnitrophota bacterium]
MIAVIDYGMGNLGSVSKALKSLGAEVKVTAACADLKKADKIVLPGVGAFKDTMDALARLGLSEALKDVILSKKPYLGICLGLEILFEESTEGGKNDGLGILKGDVARFEDSILKVPHIGWNQIRQKKAACPLLKGILDDAFFYFVHSYYVRPKDKDVVASVTDYGVEFASFVWQDNIYAVQFHPEKSQENGIRFLENFIRL